VVRGEPFLVIIGEVQHQGGAINIVARDVLPLEEARRHYHDIVPDKKAMPTPRQLIDPVDEEEGVLATLKPNSHNYY